MEIKKIDEPFYSLTKDDMKKIIDLVEAKCDENPDGYKTSKWLNDLTATRQKLYSIWWSEYDDVYK